MSAKLSPNADRSFVLIWRSPNEFDVQREPRDASQSQLALSMFREENDTFHRHSGGC